MSGRNIFILILVAIAAVTGLFLSGTIDRVLFKKSDDGTTLEIDKKSTEPANHKAPTSTPSTSTTITSENNEGIIQSGSGNQATITNNDNINIGDNTSGNININGNQVGDITGNTGSIHVGDSFGGDKVMGDKIVGDTHISGNEVNVIEENKGTVNIGGIESK